MTSAVLLLLLLVAAGPTVDGLLDDVVGGVLGNVGDLVGGRVIPGLGSVIAKLNPELDIVNAGLLAALANGTALTSVPNGVVSALTSIISNLAQFVVPNAWGDEPHIEAAKFGLRSEKHSVQTEDGYILDLYRIRTNCSSVQRVVVIPQGIMSNAAAFILLREKCLAYKLARECSDVWLVSFRGSRWGRRHVSLSDNSSAYWDWDALVWGKYDLAAAVKYVSETTKSTKLRLVGVDITGYALIVMASERDDSFQGRVGRAYLFAPIIYLGHLQSPAFAALALGREVLRALGFLVLHNELPLGRDFIHTPLYLLCNVAPNTCANIFKLLGGQTEELSVKDIPYFITYTLDGLSINSFNSFLQMVGKERYLAKHDYGATMNKQLYGSVEPPRLNISKLKVPCSIYGMGQDTVVTLKDLEQAYADLPAAARQRYRVIPTFNALSPFSATHPELLHDPLGQDMKADYAADGLPGCDQVCK